MYCPPNHRLKKDDHLKLLGNLGERFIIRSDFNAKHVDWGSRMIRTEGRGLWKSLKENRCEVISTGTPTYWPSDHNKISDLIDFFTFKNMSSNYMTFNKSYNMSSNHSPIISEQRKYYT